MKKVLVLATCVVLLLAGAVRADTLTLGSHYTWIASSMDGTNLTVGGGSFDYSSWNGTPLNYIYCVDFFHHISLNGTYGNAAATATGVVNGVSIHNAGKVAWLLDNYGTGGNGANAYALQAAIWRVIYDGTGSGVFAHTYNIGASAPSAVDTLYDGMLSALGNRSGNISSYLWITPSGTNAVQGQVASLHSVPESGTMMLLGAGLIGLAGWGRKKFRKMA